MSKYIVLPGRGKVKVDNSLGCGKVYTSGNESSRSITPYERTKQQVYATGNKWAIENFHATHD